MSDVLPNYQALSYHHSSDFPQEVWHTLSENEAAANVILPFAKKALNIPRGDDNEQLWVVLYDGANNVEFILSCTRGPLGNYPIFIVSSKSPTQLAQEEESGKNLADSLLPLVRCLLDEVPLKRVFSVFSIARVTQKFSEIFEAEAHARQAYGIRACKTPYYDATFTFCTTETFNESLDLTLRPRESKIFAITLCANMTHVEGIKVLCKAFSETSQPFVLDDAGAELEAKIMIANEQVWIHVLQEDNRKPEIACLVATTRESDDVTAVTKVFTAERWRGYGCAARLLHCVCEEILQEKKRVVLYVGNSNDLAPARGLYKKVGFQGMDGQPVEGVERWVEIGFEGTERGHW